MSGASRKRLVTMRPRDPQEAGRAATSLELFFDLVFVVAVSISSVQLHHSFTEGHILEGVQHYAIVFFGIWWAWMNFTWFATSFDTDDWLYRLLTIFQMGGVLVLAAGIEPAFAGSDMRLLVYGYVVMRVAMVTQWLRASRSAGAARKTTKLYAIGIAIVQVLWLLWTFIPPGVVTTIGLIVLVLAELSVPVAAEQWGGTPWHPHHITERYGLFTLIVLGESLLGSANAIIEALHEQEALSSLVWVAVLTLVVTASLWWIYFWPPHHEAIDGLRNSLRYGYVHYFVFGAAGALSAGIEVLIDVSTGHSKLNETTAAFTFAVPVAIFVLGIWWICFRAPADRVVNIVVPLGALLILAAALIPATYSVIVTAVILVGMVVVLVARPPVRADTAH